jgi:hypothetical protein
MVVLVFLLLVLLNLGFGQTPSDTQLGVIDALVEQHRKAIEKIREAYGITKTEGCKYTMAELRAIASRHGMLTMSGGMTFIQLPSSSGFEYYQTDDNMCRVIAYEPKGTLSPPTPMSVAPIGRQILTRQDVKFGVDVSLFRVLFQLLMYAAGIFWAVRAAQKFIEGDLTEFFITFLTGFIIVASMYVLYRWMLTYT